MITYTFWDFLVQSLAIGFINLCVYGGLAGVIVATVLWRREQRERRQLRASKVVYPASWHRPGPLEDV